MCDCEMMMNLMSFVKMKTRIFVISQNVTTQPVTRACAAELANGGGGAGGCCDDN